MPKGTKIIEEQAFEACSNVSKVVIPNSITEIKDRAFSVIAISDVTYQGTTAQWNKVMLESTAFTGHVTVHCTDGDVTI